MHEAEEWLRNMNINEKQRHLGGLESSPKEYEELLSPEDSGSERTRVIRIEYTPSGTGVGGSREGRPKKNYAISKQVGWVGLLRINVY